MEKEQHRRMKTSVQMRNVLLIGLIGILIALIFFVNQRVQTVKRVNKAEVLIDGEEVGQLSEEKAIALLEKKYPWNLTIVYGEESYEVENLIAPQIESVVQQAYEEVGHLKEQQDTLSFWEKMQTKTPSINLSYDLILPDVEEVSEAIVEELAQQWGNPAKNAQITGYDASHGTFLVSEATSGTKILTDELKDEIVTALSHKEFQQTIQAFDEVDEPDIVSSDYRVMSTYQTTTTANEDRNTNIRLASEAILGRVMVPGEQFSFNEVVGKRTPEKGYQQAAAYANGQTVQEYGGGVCQVSSTLYNAVVGAGLDTDVRKGHTFEPTYVTPGQDATVSYSNPDFVFTNSSNATIGLKTIYRDRKMYVEIYGVPILEEGTKRYMSSYKKSDIDPPAPTYVEDASVPYGTQVVQKSATNGSIWVTNLVTEKDGKVIEEEYLHQTRYEGHAATIRRNTKYPNIQSDLQSEPDQEEMPVESVEPEESDESDESQEWIQIDSE